jgi:transcriptional regulator with XRE-family HTH domain
MPSSQELTRRLADLLRDPRENLDVELKGWLDIVDNQEHRAVLAKALIALANHGGGFVIIGFEDTENGVKEAQGRPANLAGYTPDTINAVVLGFIEPPFHCDVQIIIQPETGLAYPVITVPGGHQVPIKAKRSGPHERGIQKNLYYIRRPGPQSEPPQTGQEWDALIRRCVANARDDLLDRFRSILAGGGTATPVETDLDRVNRWFEDSLARWKALAEELPSEHGARLQYGHYAIGYQIIGIEPLRVPALLEALQRGVVRHTGWPPFWVPTRQEIAPYPFDGNVECWLGRENEGRDPAHSDFWRASPHGQLFLIRGYEEDGWENKRTPPGTVFDITLPTWRIGEVLLHAASMAKKFEAPQAQIILVVEWTGLTNRELLSFANKRRALLEGYHARQDRYRTNIAVQAEQISDTLPELVYRLVRPLYELFDFFQLPATLVSEELAEMRGTHRR